MEGGRPMRPPVSGGLSPSTACTPDAPDQSKHLAIREGVNKKNRKK